MGGDGQQSRRLLPARPSSVPAARRAIRKWLTDADRGDLVEDAELAVTEVVTRKRLLDLIPTRFRQAHLAGVTLHLVNGRAPLLGAPITVPMLCADGSERPVELTITRQRLPHGRAVFVAAMRSA